MRVLLILLLLVVGFLIISGGGEDRGPPKEQRLILYEERIRDINNIHQVLLSAYNDAKIGKEIVFNGYRVSASLLERGESVTVDGITFTGFIGRYVGGDEKVRKTRDADVAVVRITFTKVDEEGMKPPVVSVGSPLLSLLLLGPVKKDVTLTALSVRMLLENGEYFVYHTPSGENPHCYFDTADANLPSAEGKCIFVIPSDIPVKELIIVALPSEKERIARAVMESVGYPILRIQT